MELGSHVVLQRPLSRCERGPGLILIRPSCYADCQKRNDSLDPEPLKKWAEESFAVVQITFDVDSGNDPVKVRDMIKAAKDGLKSLEECTVRDKYGLIGMLISVPFLSESYADDALVYGSKTDYPPDSAAVLTDVMKVDRNLALAVCFDHWGFSQETPSLFHALNDLGVPAQGPRQTTHRYADVASPGFIIPGHAEFKISTAGVAHTRSLGFLKKHLGGPYFNLEAIWDEHTYYEFGDRSVDKTMATMVQEPYVNHVPTV
jgi:carboxymethylenebutenolidase